jgi:hypothetical protein
VRELKFRLLYLCLITFLVKVIAFWLLKCPWTAIIYWIRDSEAHSNFMRNSVVESDLKNIENSRHCLRFSAPIYLISQTRVTRQ